MQNSKEVVKRNSSKPFEANTSAPVRLKIREK